MIFGNMLRLNNLNRTSNIVLLTIDVIMNNTSIDRPKSEILYLTKQNTHYTINNS